MWQILDIKNALLNFWYIRSPKALIPSPQKCHHPLTNIKKKQCYVDTVFYVLFFCFVHFILFYYSFKLLLISRSVIFLPLPLRVVWQVTRRKLLYQSKRQRKNIETKIFTNFRLMNRKKIWRKKVQPKK